MSWIVYICVSGLETVCLNIIYHRLRSINGGDGLSCGTLKFQIRY